MSGGIGEAILVEVLAEIIVKTGQLTYHVLLNSRRFADEAADFDLRLRLQLGIWDAIKDIIHNEKIRARMKDADLATYIDVMGRLHQLIRGFVKRRMEKGPKKDEILQATSLDECLQKLEEHNGLSAASKKEQARTMSRLRSVREEIGSTFWGKHRTEEVVSEIEFWGNRLGQFCSWTIPAMFSESPISEVGILADDRLVELKTKSQVMEVLDTTTSTSTTTPALTLPHATVKTTPDSDTPKGTARPKPPVTTEKPKATNSSDSNINIRFKYEFDRKKIIYDSNEGVVEGFVRAHTPNVEVTVADLNRERERRSDLGGIERRRWAKFIENDGTANSVIVEFKSHPVPGEEHHNVPDALKKTIDKLIEALRVASTKPRTFHVLDAEGWFEAEDHFGIVYRLPQTKGPMQCQSLGNILLEKEYRTLLRSDLENRLKLAKGLAGTLLELHSVNWVHKSLHPHNILFFGNQVEDGTLRFDWSSPYLVGFDSSRRTGDATGPLRRHMDSQESQWTSRLYTHPLRLNPNRFERFKKTYDIYSLGIILLEIGLLSTFMENRDLAAEDPFTLRNFFVEQAKTLHIHLGMAYRDVVLECLNGQFVNSDDDYVLVGEFRTKVCDQLELIKIS